MENTERSGIASLNSNGSLDSFYPAPGGVNGHIIVIDRNSAGGSVLIGGIFTTVAGISRPYFARLIDDGSPTPAPTPSPTPDPTPTPVTGAPSNLTAVPISTSRIGLTWIDNSDNEEYFEIERCQGSGKCKAFFRLANPGANITRYSDTGLRAATTYFYRIPAVNGGGNSLYSNTAKAKTLRR